MMISAMLSRRDRSFISSRICAWMVTSSAVVGSSAMMSLGLQASPIAIITRWRMPPESWCGYCCSRRSPSVMPTSCSSSSARALACASVIFRWMNSGSMICSPIERTGLSEVIGSWKIIEMSRPRISRISFGGEFEQVAAFEQHAAFGHPAGGLRQQAHDGERRHRLAAAGLADDGDHLAAIDGVGNAVDRVHDAARGVELDMQILHREQRRRRAGGRGGVRRRRGPCCQRLIQQRFLPRGW